MAEEAALSFGLLLRRTRRALGLTQEELAERAGLSPRVISELERGGPHAPRKDTVALLVEALGLAGEEQADFTAAARPSRALGAVALPSKSIPTAPGLPALPLPPTPLLGREQEQAALTHLLEEATGRLVTLTGPAGVGKTRLALQVAADLQAQGHFADGVAFVALAPLREPALVAGSVAQVLGVKETGSRPLVECLAEYLRDRHLLLLLDNFEHLPAAAPLVAELLAGSARLVVLVTSRAALRLRGEQQYVLAPLALPDPARADDPLVVGQAAAVRLFAQRAQAVRADFALTARNAAAVAQICVRLEGLPLALELAAARAKLLPPAALLERLERRLPLLVGGALDAPERQRTMRATIAWSHELLHAGEKALFRRLAVFAGGCTLAAVEAVCRVGEDLAGDLLDWLGSLVDQSLLQVAETDEEPRFGMLETVREYGLEQLDAAGEAAVVRDRHLAWYLTLANQAARRIGGAEREVWLDRLEVERDNIRTALQWSSLERQQEAGLRLAAALEDFWYIRGYAAEGRRWLDGLLERGGAAVSAALRARAVEVLALLTYYQGEYAPARRLFEAAHTLHSSEGNLASATWALNYQGLVAVRLGEYQRATTLLEQVLPAHREQGDLHGVGWALSYLASICHLQGDYAQAAALHGESLAVFQELGDKLGIGHELAYIGSVARDQGDYGQAKRLYRESLRVRRAVMDKHGVAASFAGLAVVAEAEGQPLRAARLFGAEHCLREVIGTPMDAVERTAHVRAVAGVSTALGEEAFAAAWAEGRALPLEEAIALALEGHAAVE
jgi:predicted ATPase/transcriptional regulator with XRE-family HTH domain